MRWAKSGLAALGVVVVGISLIGCVPEPHSWSSELVSVDESGDDSGNHGSGRNGSTTSGGFPPGSSFVVSADGSTIAFLSYASNLGPTDPGASYDDDIYVRDLEAGTTTLATPAAPGKPHGGDSDVRKMALNADGTKVAFTSASPHLVATDTNGTADVFVRDLVAGTTELVSANADGTDSANATSNDFALSADGTKVAFTSRATNLGPPNRGDTSRSDVYLRDLTTGQTTLLSALADGLDGVQPSSQPAFSPTGDAVAFTSGDSLGVETDDGRADVFLHDLSTHTNTLISTAAPAPEAAQTVAFSARAPVFSPDGGAVAYEVDAVYAVGTSRYSYHDVDVVDLDTGAVELVSSHPVPTDPELNGDKSAHTPVFSPDGTKILFETGASYFGQIDTNHDDFYRRHDLYIRDLAADTTSLVSMNTEGSDAMGGRDASFSPDGQLIAFSSLPVALGARTQVYLREPAADRTTVLQVGEEVPDLSSTWENNPTFLASGTRLAFVTDSSNLGPTDTNGSTDVYVATGTRPTP